MDGSLVGPLSARVLTDLVNAGETQGAFGVGAGGRAVEWVRVTGGSSPWWTGVVEVPLSDDTWQTLDPCEVKTAHKPLTAGTHHYLCRRTGDKDDGTPRFVAVASAGGADGSDPSQQDQAGGWTNQTVVTAVSCSGGSLSVTTTSIKVLV